MIDDEFGGGTGDIWLTDLSCSGREASIADCPHSGWGGHNCVHLEDVAIRCYETTTATGWCSTERQALD